jgi:glucose-6-phosphate 1-dehydrogenase
MAQLVPVETFDLVIFGGTGDLAMRKLLPALYHRDRDGQITPESRIIAASRGELERDAYLALVEQALRSNLAAGEFDEKTWRTFASRIHYAQADASAHDQWGQLVELLDGVDNRVRVAYLATAPSLFGTIAEGLSHNRLVTDSSRIVLEKPLGRDLDSAREINEAIGRCFAEHQIYRIDHYLGKETVQNLLALRFGNSLFEPLWRRSAIDNVQITVAEELGVGGRVEFYDRVGALRDMVERGSR